MARPVSCSQDQLLDRFEQVFRASGYEAASMAALANSSGLAKAALYHRFPDGKEAMAAAVLERVGRYLHDRVVGPLVAPGDPRRRLHAMVQALDAYYRGGRDACLSEMFSIEGTPGAFRAQLKGGMAVWLDALEALLVEAGIAPCEAERRALDAICRVQGYVVVARILGDPSPFGELMARLPDELLATPP